MPILHTASRLIPALLLGLWLVGCTDDNKPVTPPELTVTPPGPGEAISFQQLPGWDADQVQEIWPAMLSNCKASAKMAEAGWQGICQQLSQMTNPDSATLRQFIEQNFTPYQLFGEDHKEQGLLTGYYEPLLMGSYQRDERFKYPLYGTPKDMLTIDLGDLYPELKDKRVRGRLVEGNRVVPYYDRAQIDGPDQPLAGQEILWVDNREDAFFLQIQGSGRVQLPDGKVIGVGYANQNGQPYVAIGKRLYEWGELPTGGINMFTIKQWLRDYPNRADVLLNENPSYVFFTIREQVDTGPSGSLGVPLTAGRSLAIDRKVVKLGTLMWIDSTYPEEDQRPLQRLMLAQDTGGAIKGDLRGDFFFGTGKQAEAWAGHMKQPTRFYILLPGKDIPEPSPTQQQVMPKGKASAQ